MKFHKKDGYEPSDTETEWQESPWNDPKEKEIIRNYDNLQKESVVSKMFSAANVSPPGARRKNGKLPHKPSKDDSSLAVLQRNISPFSKLERRRHESSHKAAIEDIGSSSMRMSEEEKMSNSQLHGGDRVSQRPSYNRRSVSTPRLRVRAEEQNNVNNLSQRRERAAPSFPANSIQQPKHTSRVKSMSVGEMNEMIADEKIRKGVVFDEPITQISESMSPGDIFFSRDSMPIEMKKNVISKGEAFKNYVSPKPKFVSQRNDPYQQVKANADIPHNGRAISSGTVFTRTSTTNSAVSRDSNGRVSTESSKFSDVSGRTSESTRMFVASRRKMKNDKWFDCMRKGTCGKKSPERREFNEALFIEKSNVVENLRQFWADQHQPVSLNGFNFHKHEAQLLKQLVSQASCPHILFKGPNGSGKRVLTMALLREIFGDSCRNVSHELRHFHIQERKPMQVVVPLTSSAHHVELNLSSEANAKYALLGLAKEISSEYSINMESVNLNPKANFKVIVLLDVHKAAEDIQHLLKWIMDGYKDACRVILCCEDDAGILETVKNRCKVIKVNPPVTHEIMEVLIQIAEKEEFDLSMNFASKIATKAKQNLRRAIMGLEACKAHNYPFTDDQPIPIGWEEALVELAAQILDDPSNTRLHAVREKIQKLLADSVHPKLILQKLVEQFLKRIEQSSKRELFYWHAYYNKRLPTTETGTETGALSKLEEFVAKFMSIYRKSSVNFLYV